MSYRDGVAARARKEKEAHPERYCKGQHCLWRTHRTDGTRRSWCKHHEGAEHKAWLAEQAKAGTAPPQAL
jgi:hypothetical protein